MSLPRDLRREQSFQRRIPGLARGRHFTRDFEAVVGSAVADATKVGPGTSFVSIHGGEGGRSHLASAYEVVGVLQPSGARAVEPTMDVTNVARAVVYMASLPLDANVLFMTVMATKMPFVGRG